MGAFTSTTLNNKLVDCYAVCYYTITNASKSHYYVDPESNKLDSERTAARVVKKTLKNILEQTTKTTEISEQVLKTLQQKQHDWGLEFKSVEIRKNFNRWNL